MTNQNYKTILMFMISKMILSGRFQTYIIC